MNFWDKLTMYVDALGVQNCGVAWDLARVPLKDEDHSDLVNRLVSG